MLSCSQLFTVVILNLAFGWCHLYSSKIEHNSFVFDWFRRRQHLGIELSANSFAEDANLDVPELIRKHKYPVEVHSVTTADGYILTLHRIPKEGKQTILLVHGFLDSAAAFVLMGPNISLGYLLHDLNYDVWLANTRGNHYSRKHVELHPEDSKFWDFSWHEIGVYDMPATIEYIENVTNIEKIFLVGHSQGATSLFVMCSMRPEMNAKIRLTNAFAPITFIHHIRTPLMKNINKILKSSKSKSMNEIMPRGWLIQDSKCFQRTIYKRICLELISALVGRDLEQFNETILPVIFNHVPAGGSAKQLRHFVQNYEQKQFQCFDYGTLRNQQLYHQAAPLKYNLSRVSAPVILWYGSSDNIAADEDIRQLYKSLGNNLLGLYSGTTQSNQNFNHMDFIWSVDVRNLFFHKFFKILQDFQDGTLKYVIE